MHWLVEVSRAGEEAASERYCIEARRWQSALQEARRLRGDSGALPKLTIELLDHGYRAVDPTLHVRYVVTEAPPDMPLTEGSQVMLSTRPPPVEVALPAEPRKAAASSAPPKATSNAPRPLDAQVIRHRDERPEGDPIAYRELALAVKPGATKEEVEELLFARLADAKAAMPTEAKRYVQIAVFDHMFIKRPVRPPLATLMWKEWRGEPALAFPGFASPSEAPRPSPLSSSRAPSWMPLASSPPPAHAPSAGPSGPSAAEPRREPAALSSVAPATQASPSVAPMRPGSVKPIPVVSVGKSVPPSPAASSSPSVSKAPVPAPSTSPPPGGPAAPQPPSVAPTLVVVADQDEPPPSSSPHVELGGPPSSSPHVELGGPPSSRRTWSSASRCRHLRLTWPSARRRPTRP